MLTKNTVFAKSKKIIFILFVIYLIFNVITFPARSINTAKDALILCADVLIPSLFTFFVFASLLINLGFANIISRPVSHLMPTLFGVGGNGALCLILGIISGYPLGAVCVCDMYKSSLLSKRDAEKLLAFCNNSGPLFIIGCVGALMYNNKQIGITLYIIHIFSALCTGVILGLFNRFNSKSYTQKPLLFCTKPIGVIIKNAITDSINNMLLVCGFTVVFAVVISCIKPLLGNGILSLIIMGLTEISTGVKEIAASGLNTYTALVLTSFVIAFGGLGVHLQVSGIISKTDLSTKKYFIGKSIQAIIASVCTYFVFRNVAVNTYSELATPNINVYTIDFMASFKLSLLYMACVFGVLMLFWLYEKLCDWQNRMKRKK